ncbi:MAG: ABC transporter substrate-binding protein [Collinsella sp.]|nr:ABC transporter substrate-binding protein [Collinsella sp.]
MAIINKGMSRRSFLGLTGSVAAVAGLGLTGCGGSSSDEGSASGSTDSANRGGGVITAGSAYAPSSFDPASTGSAVGLGANWHVVEGLYGIDYHDYSTFNELATDDPKSVDDTTFEVTIRKGAKFSDGTEVTADDVVASYTACAASATYAPFFQPFESIEAKDASTVTVKTKVPNFSLLKDRLAIVRVTPATQTEEDRAKQPIGSGPWMYDSISDTEITLVPNPEYNGEYAAEDKKIQYSILTDPTARVTAQQEGSTLVMELVTADAVDQLESAGCKIDNVQGFGTRFIMFNVAKEPWNNVKVRQAVMYALDTEKMISNTFAGLATAASCYLPKSFTNYHEASTVYKTNAKKAKKLIEESGITPGAITLRTTDNEQIKGMAAQVKNDLDALGFDVTIQTDTSPATYAAIDGGEAYDILLAPGDPSCFGADPDLLLNWWYGDNVWMQTRCPWKDSAEWQKLHGLMDEALAAEGDEQQKKWNECFDIIADNAVLYPVVHVKTVSAFWDDPSTAPNGEALDGFKGIGTTSMSFRGVATVKA